MLRTLRGDFKREQKMDVNFFSRDDDVIDQALRDGQSFFTRELVKMIPQSLANDGCLLDYPLPMDTLLPRVRSLLAFLLEPLPRGRELLTPRLELTPGDHLGLIGIAHALGLPLEPLLPLP
jgi:hypothetical protein